MRRASRWFAGSLVVALVVSGVGPASAEDLSDILRRIDDAVYSGRQMIVTEWNGVTQVDVFSIEHAKGVTVLESPAGRAMVAKGRVRAGQGGFTFVEWTDVGGGDRYTVVDGGNARHLGRFADVVAVLEGEQLRMRLVVDHLTGAPLQSQIFDGDGNVFRYSAMLEFTPFATTGAVDEASAGDYEVMAAVEDADLPETLAGYRRADVYEGPRGAEQAYYSDGLFSFSLFVFDGVQDIERLAEGTSYDVDGSRYLLAATPSEVWVLWNDPDRTFVLVGDLPPDHLDAVLTELPRPGRRGLFSRLWNRIFG